MAADPKDERLPPPSETIHLPDPSPLPIVVAAGTAIALVGVVFNTVVLAAGLLLTVIAILLWVRDTRRDMAELPLEH